MKKLMGILFLAVASFCFVACGSDAKKTEGKECCHGKDKKECTPADSARCAEKKAEGKTCEPGCEKECCANKAEGKTCEPGCEKECCAKKTDDASATTEKTTETPATEEHSHEAHGH